MNSPPHSRFLYVISGTSYRSERGVGGAGQVLGDGTSGKSEDGRMENRGNDGNLLRTSA